MTDNPFFDRVVLMVLLSSYAGREAVSLARAEYYWVAALVGVFFIVLCCSTVSTGVEWWKTYRGVTIANSRIFPNGVFLQRGV